MKITALAAILLLAVLLASPFINSYNAYSLSQTFQAVSFWGSSSAPLLASPGSSNLPLTIQVINVGPNTVTSLSISFLSYFPLIPASGQARNLSSYLPVSQPGSSVQMLGYYSVFSNATQGIYNETLQIKYMLGSASYSQNLTFTVAVLGPSPVPQTFQAVAFWGGASSPLIASPGSKDLPLQLGIYNVGPNTVFNASVSFVPKQPLLSLQGQQSNLTAFMPVFRQGGSLSITGYFDIQPNATSGIYNQQLTITYSNGSKYFVDEIDVQIAITGYSNIQLSSFGYLPSSIYPGYPSAQLQVAILNNGNAPAYDVNATLYTEYPAKPLYPGSNTKFIGFVPVGQPVLVQFPLSVYNTTGAVNSTFLLNIKYNDVKSINFTIPFIEYPKADLAISNVVTPQLSVGESSAYITLSLKNEGSVAAEGASVALVPSNIFQPSIPSTVSPLLATTYLNTTVGNIMPGQLTNVTYIVSINSNIPPGSYTLLFVASWTQPGAQYPFFEVLPVELEVHGTITQSLGEQFSNPIFLGIIALLVVLVVVGIIAIARSRRKAKEG
jgi:hypothetical protein